MIKRTGKTKLAANWNSGTSKSTPSFAFTGNLIIIDVSWSGGSSSLTSVKWNGTENCTFGANRTNGGGEKMESWYIRNGTQTTSTIDVVIGSAPSNGSIIVTCYDGAGTPTQWTDVAVSGTTASLSLASVSDGSWLHASVGAQRSTTSRLDIQAVNTLQVDNTDSFYTLAAFDSSGAFPSGSASLEVTYLSVTQGAIYCEIPSASATSRLAYYEGSNDDYENGGSNGNRGQSFKVSSDSNISAVSIWCTRGGSASGTTKIQILSGSMTGTVVAEKTLTSTTELALYDSDSTYALTWTDFVFDSPVSLTGNTTYYIKMINTGNVSDECKWATDTTSPSYADGGAWYATSGADGGWTDYSATRDKNFRVWGAASGGGGSTFIPLIIQS